MANIYKNAGFNLSNTNLTTIYTVPANRTAIVKSIQINNDDASAIQTEIFLQIRPLVKHIKYIIKI